MDQDDEDEGQQMLIDSWPARISTTKNNHKKEASLPFFILYLIHLFTSCLETRAIFERFYWTIFILYFNK
jgi:hypothetical protein